MLFPPDYERHNVDLLHKGKPLPLTKEQEEIATWYAAMKETAYASNVVFNRNFLRDWRTAWPPLNPNEPDGDSTCPITDLADVDFSKICAYLAEQKALKVSEKKDPTKAKKRAADKAESDRLTQVYGYALVDGYKEKVANFRVEPPGLFRGRGAHPKSGSIKKRVVAEDITINISAGQSIPKAPPGHEWGGILHNNRVTWLAFCPLSRKLTHTHTHTCVRFHLLFALAFQLNFATDMFLHCATLCVVCLCL